MAHSINTEKISGGAFLRFPTRVLYGEDFAHLSLHAKLLYALMLDRHCLSSLREWKDEEGRVFLIYTVSSICRVLQVGRDKAMKSVRELCDSGLIRKRSGGVGFPNFYYVESAPEDGSDFTPPRSENAEDSPSASAHTPVDCTDTPVADFTPAPVDFAHTPVVGSAAAPTENEEGTPSALPTRRVDAIDTPRVDTADTSNTENNSHTEKKYYFSSSLPSPNLCDPSEVTYRLKDRIDYEILRDDPSVDTSRMDAYLGIMAEEICLPSETVRIGGREVPRELLRERFLSYDSECMKFVLDRMKEQKNRVVNLRAYLLTTLFNAPTTVDEYYSNLVQHDLYGLKNHDSDCRARF